MTPNPSEEARREEAKDLEVPADVKLTLQSEVAGKGVGIKQPTKLVETKDGEYPMCEKLSALGTEQRTLSEFMEWLNEKKLQLGTFHKHDDGCSRPHVHDAEHCFETCSKGRDQVCGYHAEELAVVHTKSEALIFEFLGIDPKQLDKERQEMLDKMSQEANA